MQSVHFRHSPELRAICRYSAGYSPQFSLNSAAKPPVAAIANRRGRLCDGEVGCRQQHLGMAQAALTYVFRDGHKSLMLTADHERMCTEAARMAKGAHNSLTIGYLRCCAAISFSTLS